MNKKSYLLMFWVGLMIVLMPSIYALEYTANMTTVDTATMGGEIGFGALTGIMFYFNTSVNIISITRIHDNTGQANMCAVYSGDKEVANGSYVGDTCTLTSPYTTNSSGNYSLVSGLNGGGPFNGWAWTPGITIYPVNTSIGQNKCSINGGSLTVCGAFNMLGNHQYFNYTLGGGGGAATGSVSVTLLSPSNNTLNNSVTNNFYFNNSLSLANVTNFFFWSNYTGWKRNQTNTTQALNINGTNFFTATLPDGNYLWNIELNLTNGSRYFAANNYTLNIDTIQPRISQNLYNRSIYFQNNATGNISFSDENLFRINVSLDGKTYYYIQNLNQTYFVYNFSVSTNNISLGWHKLMFESADGHTANSIGNYDVYKSIYNELSFYTNSNIITVSSIDGNIYDDFSYLKLNDRYSFTYMPSFTRSKYSFNVHTSQNLDIIENNNTLYKYWIISGNNWIDFYMPKYPEVISRITRIDKNTARVELDFSKLDFGKISNIEFRSIGDLNINSFNYSFWVGNYSVSWQNNVLETSTNNFYLNVTTEPTLISDINARFWFNNSELDLSSKVVGSDYYYFGVPVSLGLVPSNNSYNYSFYWQFNITNITYSINKLFNTTLLNQTVIPFILDNCSTYNNHIITYYYKDEADLTTNVLANSSGVITAWANPLFKKSFPLKYSVGYNSTYCISSSNINLSADLVSFSFTSSGYNDESYLVNNINLNSTQNISKDIFFSTTTSTTDITITLYDSSKNLVPDYIIQSWRYYPATDTYVLVDSQRTDANGQVVTKVIAGNNEYVFKVYDKLGNLVYANEKMKLYTTSYTFTLSGSITTDKTWKLSSFGCPLSYNSTSMIVKASYNDLNGFGTNYYLYVYYSNVTNSTILSSASSNLAANTLSLAVPNISNYYSSVFYITFKDDGKNYYVCGIPIDNRNIAQTMGIAETLVIAAIFVGTITLLGITLGAEIALIMLLVSVVAMFLLGFINLGTIVGGVMNVVVVIVIFLFKLYKRGY